MKMYDFNKIGYASLPSLTKEEEQKAVNLIHKYIKKKNETYYMMLNHDIHYFTLFNWNSSSFMALAEEVLSVAKSLGSVKSVEVSENGEMVEIWILNIMTNECYMYGFFAYDQGVIEV